ncbi:MAG: ABC transporter ATP-binding protein [Planctomycetes bacterium]|nr:ABC transporter ATP-binding protein [Planctomycetota bacterium]MBM3990373.1 ABC transporter ATP-binding protein [Planctomycetota bacterium]
MKGALEVRAITKRFGALTAVDAVSFTVAPGEIMGFIGPNGAGKTTTMRICSTLELPDSGDVRVDGISVTEHPREARARIGFMPDSYGAYANTTIHEYLDFFARAYGIRGDARRSVLERVIEFTSLGDLREKHIDALSKGMKQRLCLAKTLLHDPAVLILDEPAAGLDPRARVELRELVKALAGMGKSILISSHILTELAEMCTTVTVIERGTVRGSGSVESIARGVSGIQRIYARSIAGAERLERALLELPFVKNAHIEREGVAFDFEGDEAAAASLLATLAGAGLGLCEFAPKTVDLEDVFLSLTEGRLQ